VSRYILHADFDAFFASVEQLDDASLVGKAVLVGRSPEMRGVVAAASYEAREYGCRSAMPMSRALALCPAAVRVDPRMDRYREISAEVMGIFGGLTELVEAVSLDEAYLDVTESVSGMSDFEAMAVGLRAQVKRETGLAISDGGGGSKSVAKVASDMNKPDGLKLVPIGTERAFLAPLPVGDLWGVGEKTESRLRAIGVETIGDLAAQPDGRVQAMFKRVKARNLLSLARGIDEREIRVGRVKKSISAETTFMSDVSDVVVIEDAIESLAQKVSSKMRDLGLSGCVVRIKLRESDFSTLGRQVTLERSVSDAGAIAGEAKALLRQWRRDGASYRLVGVSVTGFGGVQTEVGDDAVVQPALF